MKTMKKLLAVILAMTLTMAMGICASASSQGGGDGDGTNAAPKGSITVTNAIVGETYTLYKVFDATVSDGREHDSTGISYSSEWFTESNTWFDVDTQRNITIKPAGVNPDGQLTDDAIEWLKSQIDNFEPIPSPQTATSATVKWEDLEPGYYFIDTTTGSFVTVDSITPDVEVEDKNSLPSHDKKQAAAEDGTFGDDLLEMNIGDTVYYQTEITIGKGSDKDITLTDTMTDLIHLTSKMIPPIRAVRKRTAALICPSVKFSIAIPSYNSYSLPSMACHVTNPYPLMVVQTLAALYESISASGT